MTVASAENSELGNGVEKRKRGIEPIVLRGWKIIILQQADIACARERDCPIIRSNFVQVIRAEQKIVWLVEEFCERRETCVTGTIFQEDDLVETGASQSVDKIFSQIAF